MYVNLRSRNQIFPLANFSFCTLKKIGHLKVKWPKSLLFYSVLVEAFVGVDDNKPEVFLLCVKQCYVIGLGNFPAYS